MMQQITMVEQTQKQLTPMSEKDRRLQKMLHWLQEDLGLHVDAIEATAGDASFRRYFRASVNNVSYIVMDAPVEREDVGRFVMVARLLEQAGIHVPTVHQEDLNQGFLLLSDLGKRCYLDHLDEGTVSSLYSDAFDALIRLQSGIDIEHCPLPVYEKQRIRSEMDLFHDWFLQGLLGIELSSSLRGVLDSVQDALIASAMAQPMVCVHRDYHSRNLMVVEQGNPGVLDFQDAVIGPVTYDLVSLLRDCYIAWPEQQVESWVADYYALLKEQRLIENTGFEQFMYWLDLMGLQRHLKAIGIFSRLKLRDNRPAYLGDIPRTMDYVSLVCGRYPVFAELDRILRGEVFSRMSVMDAFE